MIAGGTEAAIMPICLAAFNSARVLSTRNQNPQEACRPFDAERDGFVLGEGAAILVLEDLKQALSRNAPILAEVVGYSPQVTPFILRNLALMARAPQQHLDKLFTKQDLVPKILIYINAHGTSTPINDKIETKAIKSVLGGSIPHSDFCHQIHDRAPPGCGRCY